MATTPKQNGAESGRIVIHPIEQGNTLFTIMGTSPLILSRMSQKARQELLLPNGRANAAERASRLKHDPYLEFRAAPYLLNDPTCPTLLGVPATAFKGAMMTAALDLPGTKKTQIGRLVWVTGDMIPLFGKPYLHMSIVRTADMNHTPDVRTRVIVPQWAAMLQVNYVTPILSATDVANLLLAAGVTAGVGEWRAEKGKGNYGQFVITSGRDPQLETILQQGRAVQERAMEEAEPYDAETSEILTWFREEAVRRGKLPPSALTPHTGSDTKSDND